MSTFFLTGISQDGREPCLGCMILVDAQDHEMGVAQSRKMTAQRFGVSEGQVRQIEREGLAQQWPPL